MFYVTASGSRERPSDMRIEPKTAKKKAVAWFPLLVMLKGKIA